MASVASSTGPVPLHSAHDEQKLNAEIQWQPQNLEHFRNMDVLSAATCSNAGPLQKKIKAKRKTDSLSATLCAAIVKHQLGRPLEHLVTRHWATPETDTPFP